jgi:hypothetical protein
MYIKNTTAAAIYRAVLALICLAGIILNVVNSGGTNVLLYYTLQSNIAVLLYFSFVLFLPRKTISPTFKGIVMAGITLTFLVYHFILQPTLFQMDASEYAFSLANVLAHYVVPLMTLADWLLFDEKGRFTKWDPLKWTLLPLAYFAFALIRAQFGVFPGISQGESRFPYFFIDVDVYGIGRVLLHVLLISVGYVLMDYLFYFTDRLLARLGARRPDAGRRP